MRKLVTEMRSSHEHLVETDLNTYRFKKHTGELLRILKHEASRYFLGQKAVESLIDTTSLLVPAKQLPNSTIAVSESKLSGGKVPIWFSDIEQVMIDPKTLALLGGIYDGSTKEMTDIRLQMLLDDYGHLFEVNVGKSSGVTIGLNGNAFMLIKAGIGTADMTEILCHELVHTRQIVSGNSQHDDDEVAASMELEAYDYQSRIEKALVVILPKEELFSLQVLSGIARSINFVRSKYAAKGAPYQVTPRMKQELRDRNLLQHVYTKAESVLEK